jgi:hypothetical protein
MRAASLAAAVLVVVAGAGDAVAQVACRPDRVGNQSCLGPHIPPPLARPPGFAARDGLTKALDATQAGEDLGPEVIPSRRQNRLGTTFTDAPNTTIGGRCRADRLGNLVCN